MTCDEFYLWLAERGVTHSLTQFAIWRDWMPHVGATQQDAELALVFYRAQLSILKTL